jgi:hypothetical protein
MKRSTVPAQITTVEDRIFGGLTPQQLALLMAPFLLGFVMFALMPPNFHLTPYKLTVVVALEVICAALSARIKDKILLYWLITIVQYNLRPRLYVFDKNDPFLRPTYESPKEDAKGAAKKKQDKAVKVAEVPRIALHDAVRAEAAMLDPRAKMRFETGKDGKLNVIIQEIK